MGESKLSSVLNIAIEIFEALEVRPLIQISNMMIPKLLVEMFDDLTLDDFRHINIEKFLNLKIDWLEKLVYLQHPQQVDELLEIVPPAIRAELEKMKSLCEAIGCPNSVLAPLYYAKMLYYDELFFRVIQNNEVFARGGRYKNAELSSVGFAIYTDVLVETKAK